MSKKPSNEYELLYQFEVIFRDGEYKTQAATRDYSKAWESIIDNPPDAGVTPIHVCRLNGVTCAVIAGIDELLDNEECAMEIVRLARRLSRYDEAVELLRKLTSYQPLSDSDDGYIVAHEEASAFLAEDPKP